MYDWTLTSNSIVAFGALLNETNDLKLGFFRVPLRSASSRLEIVQPYGFDKGEFYLVGNHYLASIGDEAFFIQMSKRPAIYRLPPGADRARKLDLDLPPRFQNRPDFTKPMTGPKTAPAHFDELEKFSIPVRLYAQGNMLYLLTRNPDGKGTAWTLWQINPTFEEIVGYVRLPTSSDFLTIVPGDQKWFVLERGKVKESQQQDNGSMLVIPSDGIDSLKRLQICPR